MKRSIFFLVAAVFIFTKTAFAETSLKAEVDKASITTDETISYKLVITSSEKQLPQPQLPKFDGFSVISSSQASQLSIAAGNIKTSFVYTFILLPKSAGKFKIEPSQIKIKGQAYTSAAFEIEVMPGKEKPKAPQEEIPSPEKAQPKSKEPQITL